RFIKTASYGDVLQIRTSIAEWREKSFVQRYRVFRDADAIMECDEVRIFAARREDGSIRAVPIPESIRVLCE
ncbi:MAG TPA: acyl-CoA thioesterase, partial [Ramlibacter sp.]|nr:acyl-CoA thioesterase [Ramlibacter sp.]